MSKLKRVRSEKQESASDEPESVTRRERTTLFAGAKWTFARALFIFAAALSSYAGTTTYTYDVHGRLTTVTTPNGALDQSITTNSYDNAGNRQSVVITAVEGTPPNPPTNLTASAQAHDRIRLNWTPSLDVGGGPVSYYRVYRGGTHIASPNGPPFDDWPLAQNTSYSYTVAAVDPSGNVSTQSPPASATTLPETTPPSAPTSLQGSAVSATQVNLSWGASTDAGGSGLAGYEVFRNSALIGTSPGTSYSDTTAANGSTNSYAVRAYDGAGNRSGFSNQISVTTHDTLPPSAPGVPFFSAITGNSAVANWAPATDNVGVANYQWRLSGGAWLHMPLGVSLTIPHLSAGTTYTFEIRARDAAGNVGPASSGQFTTASVAWIRISNGLSVLPQHQWPTGPYYCGEDFDMSIPYYNAWCATAATLVYDYWYSAGGESYWWADGYDSFLYVREDRYGQP